MYLAVDGEIDMVTVGDLDAAMLAAAARDDVKQIVVDLAGVTFCDSSGLAAFDRAYAAAAGRDIAFGLINAQPPVRRALEITEMDFLLTGS